MKMYVVGFLFDQDKKSVVLIRKNKPEWQKGLLNGVGGKIENNERPHDAIVREFKEETGIAVKGWREFCVLQNYASEESEWRVYFFVNFMPMELVKRVKTMEKETIEIHKVFRIISIGPEYGFFVPNLSWLIPMALAPNDVRVKGCEK